MEALNSFQERARASVCAGAHVLVCVCVYVCVCASHSSEHKHPSTASGVCHSGRSGLCWCGGRQTCRESVCVLMPWAVYTWPALGPWTTWACIILFNDPAGLAVHSRAVNPRSVPFAHTHTVLRARGRLGAVWSRPTGHCRQLPEAHLCAALHCHRRLWPGHDRYPSAGLIGLCVG